MARGELAAPQAGRQTRRRLLSLVRPDDRLPARRRGVARTDRARRSLRRLARRGVPAAGGSGAVRGRGVGAAAAERAQSGRRASPRARGRHRGQRRQHAAERDALVHRPARRRDVSSIRTPAPTAASAASRRGRYQGVKGGGFYYDPDRSGRGTDGPGYAPRAAANRRAIRRANVVRDYPGLYELMNRPFRATGLGLPWYSVFGNHDGLVQGNVANNELFALAAVGCVKPMRLSQRGLEEVRGARRRGPHPARARADRRDPRARRRRDGLRAAAHPRPLEARPPRRAPPPARAGGVPPGALPHPRPARRPRLRPRGGAARDRLLRVLAEAGPALRRARHRRRQRRPGQRRSDAVPLARRRAARGGGAARARARLRAPSDRQPHAGGAGSASRQRPLRRCTEPVECLLLRHPGVVALVAGHQHRNRATPHGTGGRGFWEIVTAAHTDWPQQSRLLDLVDNADGTLSLFGTIVDHGGPARPGRGPGERARG